MTAFSKRFAVSATLLKHRVLRLIADTYSNIALRIFVSFFLATYVVSFIVNALANLFRDINSGVPTSHGVLNEIVSLFHQTTSPFMESGVNGILMIMLFIILISLGLTRLILSPLEEASEKQRLFAANASHELRTPLSVLKTLAEVARMRSAHLSKEEIDSFAKDISEEVDRMSRIIEFFVRFSALENGEHRLQMSPVRLSLLAKSASRALKPFADERGVRMIVAEEMSGVVHGNFTALEELLANLVKNAIAFSPRGATISVTSRVNETSIHLSVADQGQGIAEEDLPHIFEPFYQNGGKKHGGSGLGLTLVKQIAKLHRAKVDVKSKLGEGTTFTVRFPK